MKKQVKVYADSFTANAVAGAGLGIGLTVATVLTFRILRAAKLV